jgi:hypothetical protein
MSPMTRIETLFAGRLFICPVTVTPKIRRNEVYNNFLSISCELEPESHYRFDLSKDNFIVKKSCKWFFDKA